MPTNEILNEPLVLQRVYLEKRRQIRKRLAEFRRIGRESSEDALFLELAFCILTPQSRARAAEGAVSSLVAGGFPGKSLGFREVRRALFGVRFPNNKAKFLLEARELFFGKKRSVKSLKEFLQGDPKETRERLVKSVKGIGMKEASHFLRNVGLGNDLAILDVHVKRRLFSLGIVSNKDKNLSRKNYLDLEDRMRKFASKRRLTLGELDLLLWSDATGEIFK